MKIYAVSTSQGDCLVEARDKRQVRAILRRKGGTDLEPITILPDDQVARIKEWGGYIHCAYGYKSTKWG
jgi:hypothetical protein